MPKALYTRLSIVAAVLIWLRLASAVHADIIYASDPTEGGIWKFSPSGAGTLVDSYGQGIVQSGGLALDNSGNLFVADWQSNQIQKITPNGTVTQFATGLNAPQGLAFDGSGNFYAANLGNSTISKITSTGTVTQFASGGGLDAPYGLAFDSHGNLYAANSGNSTISEISPGGTVSQFASGGGLSEPEGLTFDSSGILYADNNGGTISEITSNGSVSQFSNFGGGPGFLVSEAVPEPSSVAILSLCGVVLLRRGRSSTARVRYESQNHAFMAITATMITA